MSSSFPSSPERYEALAARREHLAAWESLDWPQQCAILTEIVTTRTELLAYPYVKHTRFGFGFRGRHWTLRSVPGVTFFVHRKVAPGDVTRTIPKYLMAFATVAGGRVPVAIPTDVQQISAHSADAQHTLFVTKGSLRDFGVATVAVTVPDKGLHLISCRHVLGMTKVDCSGDPPPGRRVRYADTDSAVFGRTTRHYGSYHEGDDFDAALASLTADAFPAGLFPADITDWVFSLDNAEPPLTINTFEPESTERLSKPAALSGPVPLVRVRVGCGDTIEHANLVALKPTGELTIPGDSGAPVTDARGRLCGMYIAANSQTGVSYMIPASELLYKSNYRQLAGAGYLSLA